MYCLFHYISHVSYNFIILSSQNVSVKIFNYFCSLQKNWFFYFIKYILWRNLLNIVNEANYRTKDSGHCLLDIKFSRFFLNINRKEYTKNKWNQDRYQWPMKTMTAHTRCKKMKRKIASNRIPIQRQSTVYLTLHWMVFRVVEQQGRHYWK